MSPFRAVLFDVDGTIFSSEDIIAETYVAGFSRFKQKHSEPLDIPGHDRIMQQIGKPIVEIFETLAPGLDQQKRHELSEEILYSLVDAIGNGKGFFYPGAVQTMEKLHGRGYQLFAASNGRYPYIEAILKTCNQLEHFTALPVVDNIKIHNKTELVRSILDDYNIKNTEALMVGDRFSDRDAAIENDVAFAACRFGHGDEKELEGARFYLDQISDLLEILD